MKVRLKVTDSLWTFDKKKGYSVINIHFKFRKLTKTDQLLIWIIELIYEIHAPFVQYFDFCVLITS